MPTITPLAVAALGLLAERPMHPYEMYQLLVDRAEDRLLKVRPGSLYHAVDRLAETGLVEAIATERAGNRPERTRFRITDHGRLALTERITEMLASPAPDYPEFPLAIAQAHNLPLDEVRACIRTRIKRLTLERRRYEDGVAVVSGRGVPRRFWIDVEYQQAMCDAAIRWLQQVDAELGSGALSWDEPHDHAAHGGETATAPGPGSASEPTRWPTVGALEDDGSRPAPPRRVRPQQAAAGTPAGAVELRQTRTTNPPHSLTTHEDHR
jgi:DNA-binding PadR family transcriptional regulator